MKTHSGNKSVSALSNVGNLQYSPIILGVLLAYCISLVVFVISSLLFTFTPMPEAIMPYLTYITSVFSILIGGIYAASKIGNKGWLNGGMCGILYLTGLFLLSIILDVEIIFGFQFISRLILSFVIGAVGGILGINL